MNYQPIIDFIRSLYPGRDFIPLHEPFLGGNEKKYLADCIDTTFVSSVGKYVDRFEEMIRDYTGAKYAIATVNGTAALHVALKLAGVQPNDLVITQPLTFIATCNAIAYCGAEPVFVDVERDTLGMSPDSLEAWLAANLYLEGREGLDGLDGFSQLSGQRSTQPSKPTVIHKATKRRISACVPMHTFGHPCRIERIIEVCNRYHIPVVEDAAESIGSYTHNRHTGTLGLLGTMSFNGNKTITTGGGGMIITNDDTLGPLAKHITTTAKKAHPWRFDHDILGYNYRLPNINAALGCAQMEILDKILESKRQVANEYQRFFSSSGEFQFISGAPEYKSNYWLNAVLLQDEHERDEFLNQTNSAQVMTRPAWTLMQKLPTYSSCSHTDLSIALDIESRLVNLPSSSRLLTGK